MPFSFFFLFSNVPFLNEKDWKIILETASVDTYVAGDMIIEEGKRNHFICRIKDGFVNVKLGNNVVSRLIPLDVKKKKKTFF